MSHTLKDLFIDQVRDLYSAETQILDVLPAMEQAAHHEELQQALAEHRKETEQQAERLRKIGAEHNFPVDGVTCEGLKGLIREMQKDVGQFDDPIVKDASIIAQAQRIEHYEIAGYGTARTLANTLGLDEAAKLLDETCREEKNADTELNRIATGGWLSKGINQVAAAAE